MSKLKNLMKNNPVVKMQTRIWGSLEQIRKNSEVTRMASANPYLAMVRNFAHDHQLGFQETVALIAKEKISFARFGDGELKMMLRPTFKLAFQNNSAALAASLANVIQIGKTEPTKLMLGFPQMYQDLHWSGVWVDVAHETLELFSGVKYVGNSHVTRPIFFENSGEAGIASWREVWNGKSVRIITGKGSRFELTPALFDNVGSVAFTYSKARNAFDDLERLKIDLDATNEELYLIALGPTGTILAAELAAAGKWAIDLGHISDSYETIFKGGVKPEQKPVQKA